MTRALVGILTFEAALALVVAVAGSAHRPGAETHRLVTLALDSPTVDSDRAEPGPPEPPHPWTPPANAPFVLLPLISPEHERATLAARLFLDEPRNRARGLGGLEDRVTPPPPNRLNEAIMANAHAVDRSIAALVLAGPRENSSDGAAKADATWATNTGEWRDPSLPGPFAERQADSSPPVQRLHTSDDPDGRPWPMVPSPVLVATRTSIGAPRRMITASTERPFRLAGLTVGYWRSNQPAEGGSLAGPRIEESPWTHQAPIGETVTHEQWWSVPSPVVVAARAPIGVTPWETGVSTDRLGRLRERPRIDLARVIGGAAKPRGDAVRLAALGAGTGPEDSVEIERLIDLVSFSTPGPSSPFGGPLIIGPPLPRDGDAAATERRKASFVKNLLPVVDRLNERLLWTRRRILALGATFKPGPDLSVGEARFVADTLADFELSSWNYDELLRRADVVPPSLALAQSAMESGWGAAEGNALFGVQRFDIEGGRVLQSRRGYASVADAVSHYMKTLNTHPAYAGFRAARAAQRVTRLRPEGLALAGRLGRYSELGEDYVRRVQGLMIENNFMIYDVFADLVIP